MAQLLCLGGQPTQEEPTVENKPSAVVRRLNAWLSEQQIVMQEGNSVYDSSIHISYVCYQIVTEDGYPDMLRNGEFLPRYVFQYLIEGKDTVYHVIQSDQPDQPGEGPLRGIAISKLDPYRAANPYVDQLLTDTTNYLYFLQIERPNRHFEVPEPVRD